MSFWWGVTLVFFSWYIARFIMALLQGVYHYRAMNCNRITVLHIVFIISILWPFVSIFVITVMLFISVLHMITIIGTTIVIIFKEDTSRLYKTFDNAVRKALL